MLLNKNVNSKEIQKLISKVKKAKKEKYCFNYDRHKPREDSSNSSHSSSSYNSSSGGGYVAPQSCIKVWRKKCTYIGGYRCIEVVECL